MKQFLNIRFDPMVGSFKLTSIKKYYKFTIYLNKQYIK